MGKIYLKWAKDLDTDNFNFGDDLSPYIINNLSDTEIKYIHFANTRINIFKQFVNEVFSPRTTRLLYFKNLIVSLFIKRYIIAIGSIIQWYTSKRCIVWGSGIINSTDPIRNSTFLAVRGKYTKAKLKEYGFSTDIPEGDPALLLPLVYEKTFEKKYRLGIIPHVKHFEQVSKWILNGNNNDILLINLNTDQIENTIDQILMCEKIISSSLHGLIVPHAYDIEAIWVKFPNCSSLGDNVKFFDYFSSVGIIEYEPFDINLDEIDSINFDYLFSKSKSIIQMELKKIQKSLLSVAPFNVKDKYKQI